MFVAKRTETHPLALSGTRRNCALRHDVALLEANCDAIHGPWRDQAQRDGSFNVATSVSEHRGLLKIFVYLVRVRVRKYFREYLRTKVRKYFRTKVLRVQYCTYSTYRSEENDTFLHSKS